MSTPEVFFRETIDLNRYSNSVAKKYAVTYNEIIVNAAKKLKAIDLRQQNAAAGVIIAPQTRKRLRAIIKQSSDSLATWSTKSAIDFKKELQGVTVLQKDFIENELKKVTASGNVPINSVAISPKYAESVIMTDPSKINIFTSKAFTEDNFREFGAGKFSLTATQGAAIRLPNGTTVSKAFRGIAESSVEKLDLAVRSGVFAGESLDQITRRLVGRLEFADFGPLSVKQLALAGGELTKIANNQISTIVRTSVNQVTNQASQAVYAANKKVSPRYEYVATLDSRTSPICQRLDGQTFDYNNGPTPPQHFNCRSTTVPVVDFDGLQKKYPNLEKPPATKFDTRPSSTGRVPQGQAYGDWLLQQDRKLQIKTLGNEGKVRIFKKLAKSEKTGQAALRKMIRNDGSERSLTDLERLYGNGKNIAIKIPKPKPVTKPTITILNQDKVDEMVKAARAAERKAKAELKAIKARDPLQPTIAQLQGISPTAKVKATDVNKAFDLMDEMDGLAGENARKLRQFVEKKQVFCNWSNAREGSIRAGTQKYDYFLKNPSFKQSIQRSLKNETTYGFSDTLRSVDQALDTNDFKWVSYELKTAFTAGGKGRKRMNGMTTRGSNHIVLKAKGNQKAIKSVKQMQDDVKDAVNYAKNNQNNPNWNANEYWSAHGKGRFDEGSSWLKTLVHEMGHQVHYTNKLNKLDSYDWIPSAYGTGNYKERFAETFVQYIFSPVELKKASPSAYKWIEETLNASLQVVEKWN
ncbi:phage putative head morphogenesis protein [uncultured Mediterranean phage uvMED]|nr:phage putative head morphogenesis protein [uncultured Mediterranean phage uvMED]